MLLLWSSYTPIPVGGGGRFYGTFEGFTGLQDLIIEYPDILEFFDDDDVLIAWWMNQC